MLADETTPTTCTNSCNPKPARRIESLGSPRHFVK
jgi:hypothetical protein